MRTDTPTVDDLVDALVDAFASMTTDEQRLTVTGYRLLSAGEPVDVAALASAAGWSQDDADVRLRSGRAAPTSTPRAGWSVCGDGRR